MKRGFHLVPGVERLIKHLKDNNIPMAVATNGSETLLKSMIPRTKDLDEKWFHHYVCGADDPDVKANKPSPDIYLVCAERFTPSPKSVENCVIFEDSVTGITGAVASGMKTVLIKKAVNKKSTEFISIVDKISINVNSFDDFKPESVGLPPYQQ